MRTVRTHTLKAHPRFMDALLDGSKNFEVRRDDRMFAKGDTLRLVEWDSDTMGCVCTLDECYSRGRVALRRVVYILGGGDYGIERGFVVMALEDVDETED